MLLSVINSPMMVTVAKSLDVPIKLLIPRPPEIDEDTGLEKPQKHAMLGLGDIVLPGIMIGLALRFDLFLFYLRKQRKSGEILDKKEEAEKSPDPKKEEYVSVLGKWGEHYWTRSQPTILFPYRRNRKDLLINDATRFPKAYFIASMTGYVMGMIATLFAMHISDHAQPALLYLVPGVLISLFLTAMLRSELGLMWDYSEATDEKEDGKKDKAGADPLKNKSIFSLAKQRRQMEKIESSISDSIEIVELPDGSDAREEISATADEKQEVISGQEQQKSSFFSVDEKQHLAFFSVTISPPLYIAEQTEPKKNGKVTDNDASAEDYEDELDTLSSDEHSPPKDKSKDKLSR